MAGLLRKLSHHDVKKVSTLVRSKTYESDLTKLEKRLPRQTTVAAFGHTNEFDYKRDTKYLCRIMKHCITAHTLDLDFILHFLSAYTCEQRLILVRDLEFEYAYKLVDMVLERPESPMRSCTLAMLIEPIELYARDFRDLLTMKHFNKISSDISRKLVEILLPLSNQEIDKFQETYEHLFENSPEKDIVVVFGEESILSKLLRHFLQGKRYEEPGNSAPVAKEIAKRLYDAGEGTPGIDYDMFIKIFTHDSFSQLSTIFDIYEDKYGRPIQDAIEREFANKTDIDCFQDIVEYTRSPGVYYSKLLRQAFEQDPIDYVTLIRIIIGHQDKDLCEICLEYSKIYDETLDQTIKTHLTILEIKRLFILIITNGQDITSAEINQVLFEHSNNSSPTGSIILPTTSTSGGSNGMRRNRSSETFEKLVNVFKTMRHH